MPWYLFIVQCNKYVALTLNIKPLTLNIPSIIHNS